MPARPTPPQRPTVVVDDALRGSLSGTGLTLHGEDGADYLDAVSGTFNLPLGYDHPELVTRLQQQVSRLTHVSSHFAHRVVDSVAQKLLRWAPPGVDAVWCRDITGSTAIEGAVKMAHKYTGKTDVITLFHSHHGQTHFTTAISGNAFRREHQPDASSPHSLKVPAPYCHRCFYGASFPSCGMACVTRMQDFIDYASSGRVAAVIVEPVQGNGGNIVPPPGYFAQLRQLCDRNQIVLIVDEVQTGMGRTGQMFACETFDIHPDIIVVAKGLGGIGVPVAAILTRAEISILASHEHSFTSGANMLALAAADATLDVIGAPGFLAEVRRKAVLLRRALTNIGRRSPIVSDVRGVGFMWGLEIVDAAGRPSPVLTNRVIEVALQTQRLILRSSQYGRGNVVKVRPALVASEAELLDITQRLDLAFREVEARA